MLHRCAGYYGNLELVTSNGCTSMFEQHWHAITCHEQLVHCDIMLLPNPVHPVYSLIFLLHPADS